VGEALGAELTVGVSVLGGTGMVKGADQSRPLAAGRDSLSENGLAPGLDLTVVGAVEVDE
jgi:hypothetical protein